MVTILRRLRPALAAAAMFAAPALSAADDPDVVFWQSIDHNNADELHAYLDSYPSGKFSKLAVVRLRDIGTHTPPAPGPAANAPPPPPPGQPIGQPAPGYTPAQLPDINGPAQVLDTANLLVNGQPVALWCITGMGAPYDAQLNKYVQAQGGTVSCQPQDNGRYVCLTASGYDVAKAAMFNGAARATADAPNDYLEVQNQAKANHSGIWQADAAASPAPANKPSSGLFGR